MSRHSDTIIPAAPGLYLLVNDGSPRSVRATDNIRRALSEGDAGFADVEIVDVIREPDRILDFGVFATPALVNIYSNGKTVALYGDLSDATLLHRFLAEASL